MEKLPATFTLTISAIVVENRTVSRPRLPMGAVLAWLLPMMAAAGGATTNLPAPTRPITITIGSQPRQIFGGLGASGWGGEEYSRLAPERRARLNQLVWRDARFNTLRIWLRARVYAPARGEREFARAFGNGDAALVRDAQACGLAHLVLGPAEPPEYLLAHAGHAAPHLKAEAAPEHAAIIADFISDLRARDSISVEATGVQNEPNDVNDCQFTPQEMARSVKLLRAALDARGLPHVKILAPETVGCGGTWWWMSNQVTLVDHIDARTPGQSLTYAMLDALKSDAVAWQALGGAATHSYDGGASALMERALAGSGKEYWMTEFCWGGPEETGDYFRGAAESATFLSDVNHGVNYWIHFIAYASDDPHDDGTRLMAYFNGGAPPDGWLKVFEQYNYLKELGRVFDPGAVFRQAVSSLDNDMRWARYHAPSLAAAAARNRDGSWAVALCNYTSDHFPSGDWATESMKGRPAQNFVVTVRIGELAKTSDLIFRGRRVGPATDASGQFSATLRRGQLVISVAPLEQLTLRSVAPSSGFPSQNPK